MASDNTDVSVPDFDKKIESLMEEGNLFVSSSTAQVVKIKRVPLLLRDRFKTYEKCFEPRVLFLGPYHRGKSIPKEAEDLKKTAASLFMKTAGTSHCSEIYAEIYKKIDYLMQHYELEDQNSDNAEKNDKELNTSMLFKDGCAALYFITQIVDDGRPSFSMIFKTHEIDYAKNDLFLLENQLPYEVLEMLMSYNPEGNTIIENFVRNRVKTPSTSKHSLEILSGRRIPSDHKNLCNRVIEFLISVPAYLYVHLPCNQHQSSSEHETSTTEASEKPSQHVHLLQHLRTRLVGEKSATTEEETANYLSNSWRRAVDLADKGIFFKPSHSNCWLDVSFTGVCLHLPSLRVDDSTRTKLLNLVADEMSSDVHNNSSVVSYLELLTSLIDHPDDVKILREANIIHNSLSSDEEVTEIFNGIAEDLLPNILVYGDIKQKIQDHVDNKENILMAQLRRNYFRTPWSIITFVGAIFLTFLTVVQTYLTMFPLPDEYQSSESRGLLYGLKHYIYMLLAFPVFFVVICLGIYGLVRLFNSRILKRG